MYPYILIHTVLDIISTYRSSISIPFSTPEYEKANMLDIQSCLSVFQPAIHTYRSWMISSHIGNLGVIANEPRFHPKSYPMTFLNMGHGVLGYGQT